MHLLPLGLRRTLGGRFDAWLARRRKKRLMDALAGDAVACNVCGWQGASFTDDQWHAGTICPNCRSQVRHRLLVAALDGHAASAGLDQHALLAGRDVLHFAPERLLRDRLAGIARQYLTADCARGDCDLRIDISRMPQIQDAAFDAAIACDVLEHVPDDHAALRELHRILRPGGAAILTVPQKDPPATTDEDPGVVSGAERERRFGQRDHVRIYGDDFSERVAAAGFEVVTLDREAFPASLVNRHVLHPPLPGPHPLTTNHRRIFIARKAGPNA